MNTRETALNLYQQLKLALNDRLVQQGYAPVHEEPADAVYGNCAMLWSNNIEALRFVWNGKDQWFCLEITEDLPLRPLTHWEEIQGKPFDKTTPIETYLSDFLNSLL